MASWKRACHALGLVAALAAFTRCGANLEDADGCHYFAEKFCDRYLACGGTSAGCGSLEDQCKKGADSSPAAYPSGYEIAKCADALANLPCGSYANSTNASACFNSKWGSAAGWMQVYLPVTYHDAGGM